MNNFIFLSLKGIHFVFHLSQLHHWRALSHHRASGFGQDWKSSSLKIQGGSTLSMKEHSFLALTWFCTFDYIKEVLISLIYCWHIIASSEIYLLICKKACSCLRPWWFNGSSIIFVPSDIVIRFISQSLQLLFCFNVSLLKFALVLDLKTFLLLVYYLEVNPGVLFQDFRIIQI